MKAYILAALLLVAFGSTATVAAQKDEMAKKELQRLQGTWTVVYSEQNGERRQDIDEVRKMRLTIKDNKWTLEYNNNVKDIRVAILTLQPAQEPKAVDFKFSEGLLTGEIMPSIYELKGDNLKFCFPDESRQRPRTFDSRGGSGGHWLLALKREK